MIFGRIGRLVSEDIILLLNTYSVFLYDLETCPVIKSSLI